MDLCENQRPMRAASKGPARIDCAPHVESGTASRDRPRERLVRHGVGALADAELVALVLRTGDRRRDVERLARDVLDLHGGLAEVAGSAVAMLESIQGLGPVKAASLLAGIELGRRVAAEPLERGRAFRGPMDVQRHFQASLRERMRESFHVLMLDGRHRLIALEEVSVGTLTASLVHPREVFRGAIRHAAASILLVHNHPSGDPSPSAEDRAVTERLYGAGELLGISVIDHVIVAAEGYFSFREADASVLSGADAE